MPEPSTFAVVKDVALALIALYGAILSTFNWRQAVKRDRRQLRVKLESAIPVQDDEFGNTYIKLTATNSGHRTVSVTSLRLELENKSHIPLSMAASHWMFPATPLPAALSDGQSAQAFISYRALAEALIASGRTSRTKIIAVCEDSVGNIFKGDTWEVDPDQFLKM